MWICYMKSTTPSNNSTRPIFRDRKWEPWLTTSFALMFKLKPACTLPETTSRHNLLKLALILPVKLHTSYQKIILGLCDAILQVGIRQPRMISRDLFLRMHQAATRIRKAGNRIDLTSRNSNHEYLQIKGTSYLAQRSLSCFPIQRESQKKRK